MDGVRTEEGGEGVTGAMIRARIWVDGRLAGGLQALLGAPMAAYSGCGEPDGGIGTRQEALADWAGASLRGRWVGWWVSGGRAPSGWEWNGSQSGQGAAELLLPRPAPRKMQGQSACRAGDPSGQGKDPSSEGLGGHESARPRPMRAVQRARLWAITCTTSQAPLAAKRPEGMWFSPTAVLEVAYRILDLGVAAMIGLRFQGLPVPVGDEAVIAVDGEEGQLGTGRRRVTRRTMSRAGAASGSALERGIWVVSATSAAPSIQ